MSRATRFPQSEHYGMLRNNHSMRAAFRQKRMTNVRDRQLARHIQNRPSMASLNHHDDQPSRRLRRITPKVTLKHTTHLSLNERYSRLDNKPPPAARMRNNVRRQRMATGSRSGGRGHHHRHHQPQMMEIDYQPLQSSGLQHELRQQQMDLKQRLGKKSNIRDRLGRPLRGGTTSAMGRVGGGMLGQSRGSGGRGGAASAAKEALPTTASGRVPRGALRRRRPQSGVGPVHGEGGGRGGGARDAGGDDSGGSGGSDRRPGGFSGRGGRRRRRGRGAERTPVTREQLDNQLDSYMSKTKSHLDAELDAYMAQKTGS